MRISIGMATFNGERFIAAQLASLGTQTRLPDELIVTDDQSTDATVAIVRDFARTAPFSVRVEANLQRLGVAQNFSRALSLCSGDLVLPSDQDDVWLPQKISRLEMTARSHPAKACFINDALMVDASLNPTGTTKRGHIRAAGLPDEAMVMGCCCAFRSSLLCWLLPVPGTQPAHDNWLVQMADLLDLTVRLDDSLQYYRRHGRNVSDFVVNRLEVPGAAARMGERIRGFYLRVTRPGGLAAEQQFLECAVRRMLEHTNEVEGLLGRAGAERALSAVQTRLEFLSKRRAIRAMPRYRRLPEICTLWRRGGYLARGKTAGALKDLLISARHEEPTS